ncbi:N-6 DNA methylase [uncultured Sneathia sp.]|uniref:N-6 DNA methylase n=1 Tax=uncultured Sneathia sp. TaxID=278067 RepID=UPI0028052426|nr:N-6 DNA methylase [uncultured Sneathia sp.]
MAQFEAYEGTKGGEFYTPSSIVKTIIAILKLFNNCRVYDIILCKMIQFNTKYMLKSA